MSLRSIFSKLTILLLGIVAVALSPAMAQTAAPAASAALPIIAQTRVS